MKAIPMKFLKGLIVLSLCLLLWACIMENARLEIDIGDYEGQLEAWNSQNMLDYQLLMFYENSGVKSLEETVTVRNGIPENLPIWPSFESTIPEYYSLVEKQVEKITKRHDSGKYDRLILRVKYNAEYHYPEEIEFDSSLKTFASGDGGSSYYNYTVTLTPLEKTEPETEECEE